MATRGKKGGVVHQPTVQVQQQQQQQEQEQQHQQHQQHQQQVIPKLSLFGVPLHHVSPTTQSIILVGFTFATELSYGYCQEYLYGVYKFPHAWFSTFMQCIFYTAFSGTQYILKFKRLPSLNQSTITGFPHFEHLMIGSASLVSRVSGNAAFNYMDYSLKVLFTSANPIVVLATGVFYKQKYSFVEYASTSMLAAGLIAFSYADSKKPGSFSIIGVLLMFISVSTDAFKLRTQELVMKHQGCSEIEVTLWSSLIGSIASFFLVIFSDQWNPSIAFFTEKPEAFMWMLIFIFGYISTIATLTLILASDAFIASIISTTRKATTVFMSFLAFGKPFTIQHVSAIVVFFGGVMWQAFSKKKPVKEKL